MPVTFVNNQALLSDAFNRIANQNVGLDQALAQATGAVDKLAQAGVKQWRGGQIAQALGQEGTDYGAAATRAAELGDQDLALKYASLRDADLARQADIAYKNEYLRLQGAKATADADKALRDAAQKEKEKAQSQESLNRGLDDLEDIAKSGDLTTWGYRRAGAGFGSEKHRVAEGKLKAAIAAIAPTAIQRLKEAGVSGINTQGEFFNYIGLPENPTSDQLAGALPRLKETLGYTVGSADKYKGLL